MNNPDVDPALRAHAKNVYNEEEKYQKEIEARQQSQYIYDRAVG